MSGGVKNTPFNHEAKIKNIEFLAQTPLIINFSCSDIGAYFRLSELLKTLARVPAAAVVAGCGELCIINHTSKALSFNLSAN